MPKSPPHVNAGAARLLSSIGGFVDGVGYLTLYELFISHMSGNSTMLGLFIAEQNWPEVLHRAVPIVVFVGGVFLGGLGSALLAARHKSPAWIMLLIEAALLAAFALLASPYLVNGRIETAARLGYYGLVALPALAMGIQNVTIKKVGSTGVRTTFVSGTLTTMSEEMAASLLWFWTLSQRGRTRRGLCIRLRLLSRTVNFRRSFVLASIWACYVTGAIAGVALTLRWQLWSVAIPVTLLTLFALWLATKKAK